jgi:hypothetical protein
MEKICEIKKMLREFGNIRSQAQWGNKVLYDTCVNEKNLTLFCDKIRKMNDTDLFNFVDSIRRAGELHIQPKFYENGSETLVETTKGIFLIQSQGMTNKYEELEELEEIPENAKELSQVLCYDIEIPDEIL